jgi:hypothetical protein
VRLLQDLRRQLFSRSPLEEGVVDQAVVPAHNMPHREPASDSLPPPAGRHRWVSPGVAGA